MRCVASTHKRTRCLKQGRFVGETDQENVYCCTHFKMFNSPTCSICLEYIDSKDIKITRCKHYFHNACWKTLIDHSTTCPMCRKDISNEYANNNTSFAVSIIRNDCEISLNYDAHLLFGHKGLHQILKKRCDNRSTFVLKRFTEYYLNDRHELIESNHLANTFENSTVTLTFGNISTNAIALNTFPLAIQYKMYNKPGLLTMAQTIYDTLHNVFNEASE